MQESLRSPEGYERLAELAPQLPGTRMVSVAAPEACPDLDAQPFFDPDEIQAAYLLRDKAPPAKPRPNDVLRQIACLGGFLARQCDGEPGVKTIWLGLKDVHVAVKTMRALRSAGMQKGFV